MTILFKEAVENKFDESKEQLKRLITFKRREAQELIQHCIMLSYSISYKDAITLMQRLYGNPHTIAANRRKNKKLSIIIKRVDSAALKKFNSFLMNWSITPGRIWNDLDTPYTLCSLSAKFPENMKGTWNKIGLQY